MVERGLSWEKAFEIYKQNVKVEDENSESSLDHSKPNNKVKNVNKKVRFSCCLIH